LEHCRQLTAADHIIASAVLATNSMTFKKDWLGESKLQAVDVDGVTAARTARVKAGHQHQHQYHVPKRT